MAARVQFQVRDAEHFRLWNVLAATHQGAHAGQQFGKLERLDQVIVGAHVQALDLVSQPATGGEHHHALGTIAAQFFQHLPAILARQVDVQNHQFIGVLPGQVQAVDTIGGAVDHVATFVQALLQVVGGFLLVFNHKNTHGGYLLN